MERWVENCLKAKDGRKPFKLALGRYLKERWFRKLERQNGFKQSQPSFTVSKWQPPGLAYSQKIDPCATTDQSASPWT